MQKSTFANGSLNFGPRTYNTLLVVECETIQPETAKAFKRFADVGGQIVFIGKTPHQAPGFYDHAGRDSQVDQIIKSINTKNVVQYPSPTPDGKIVDWYKVMQEKLNLKPFIKIDKPQMMVSQVHYKTEQADAYFFSNYSNSDRFELNAEFDVAPNRTAWLWNPETGERFLYPTQGKKNKLKVMLGPAETQLIVFDNNTQGVRYEQLTPFKNAALTIKTPWTLTLNHYNGSIKTRTLNNLLDFRDDAGLVGFAGNAIYENTFQIANIADVHLLNLGKVAGVSEVTLNGKNLGNRWYGDHIYSLKGAVKAGVNKLSIKLTTTLGNYMMTDLKENKDTIKWLVNKKQTLYPQGIIGPVELG